MKIIFLCGSLEPGSDGVGDYTRRLAGELIRQGHEAAAIAINDKYVTETWQGKQKDVTQKIAVLRLSALQSWKLRIEQSKIWIDDFNPEWLSLQYVPFAFHLKGLHYGLVCKLYWLGIGRRWHVMFHELWVGIAREDPLKLKLWGFLQQYLVKSLLSTLRPVVIHTQTYVFQAKLLKLGFKVNYLPLFSNIPIKEVYQSEKYKFPETIILILFGIIHKKAPIELLAREAAMYSRENNKKIHLMLVGRNGNNQQEWINAWNAVGLTIEILGEQSPDFISELLNNASAGISTTASAIVEKSGSFSALYSHGLPVLCVSRSWTVHGVKDLNLPKGVINYSPGNFRVFLQQEKHGSIIDLNNVAKMFISSLIS